MRKLTRDEIRTAGKVAREAYNSDGYWAGKEIADELKAKMVLSGATSSDDIYEFEQATGYSYYD